MDPARTTDLQEYLAKSADFMDQQDEQVLATARAVQVLASELTTQVQHLSSPNAPAPPPVPHQLLPVTSHHEPRILTPERYSGEHNLCRAFLTKCSIFFFLQLVTFASEESKVALVITVWMRSSVGGQRCGRTTILAAPRSVHSLWK